MPRRWNRPSVKSCGGSQFPIRTGRPAKAVKKAAASTATDSWRNLTSIRHHCAEPNVRPCLNTPTRSEPTDSEHRGSADGRAGTGRAAPEGWLTRVMRILFGWKAAATRADLELVLTAEQPQSGFSPEEAAMLKNILGLRECRIESVMVPRADIVAVQQDIAHRRTGQGVRGRRPFAACGL